MMVTGASNDTVNVCSIIVAMSKPKRCQDSCYIQNEKNIF